VITRIDARGLRCPWPSIKLARALREGATIVEIVADDPAAPAELAALVKAQGGRITASVEDGAQHFQIIAAPPVNRSFTRDA